MNTSEAPRNTMARNPSHFGSYRKPSPAGSSVASLASIGSIGGAIANSDAGSVDIDLLRRILCSGNRRGGGLFFFGPDGRVRAFFFPPPAPRAGRGRGGAGGRGV